MSARVLVGVVTDDGEPRHGRIEAPLEAAERCRDLVDRTVQAVDPSLERDGEVDEVAAAAAEQRELCRPDAAQPQVEDQSDRDGDDRDGRSRDRDPAGDRGANG